MTPYRDRLNAGQYTDTAEDELTVDQLKAQLKAQGKPVSGTKDELLKRLNEN